MNETENRNAASDAANVRLEKRARELFAESTDGLDAATRSRLTRARAEAVAAAGKSGGWRRWLTWLRAGPGIGLGAGVAAAGALAAVLVLQNETPQVPGAEIAALDDLEILLDEDELELYEELEFYAWLLEQPELLEIDTEDSSG